MFYTIERHIVLSFYFWCGECLSFRFPLNAPLNIGGVAWRNRWENKTYKEQTYKLLCLSITALIFQTSVTMAHYRVSIEFVFAVTLNY